MPRYADYTGFAENFVRQLPSLEDLEARDSTFWDLLEVNAERVLDSARQVEFLKHSFSSLGAGGLQALSLWTGLEPLCGKS
jgi:hypothetical protein